MKKPQRQRSQLKPTEHKPLVKRHVSDIEKQVDSYLMESDTRVKLVQINRENNAKLDHATGIKSQSEQSGASAVRLKTQAVIEKWQTFAHQRKTDRIESAFGVDPDDEHSTNVEARALLKKAANAEELMQTMDATRPEYAPADDQITSIVDSVD